MNVLLITADQWRADCLGALASALPNALPTRTPALDSLARDAVLFRRHYTQATPCGPSRAALLTGTYSFNNRSIANGTPLDARHRTIAQLVQRQGYRPLLFGYTDTSIDPRSVPADDPRLCTYEGIAPGFSSGCVLLEDGAPWLDHLARRGYGRLTVEEAHAGALGDPALYAAEDSETAFLTDRFLDFLQAAPAAEPWFVHLSYIKPHPPWVAPAPYHAIHDRAALPKPRREPSIEKEAARHPYLQALLDKPFSGWVGRQLSCPAALSDAVVAEIRGLYLGLVSEVDRQLGRVLGALVGSGTLDQTLIVITADHGEMLGDGWQLGKQGFRPEAFHVPLMIRHPKRQKPGHVVDSFTEHVDLMPTILAELGIEAPRQCDGHALTPFLVGDTPPGWRDAAVYEHDFRDLEHGWHREALGLDDDQCGIAVRRSCDRLYAHFNGLPPLLLAIDEAGNTTAIDDPTAMAAEARALLSHRMAKAERRLTGCLLAENGPIGGYDPL